MNSAMAYAMRHSSWLGQKGGSTAQGCSGEKDVILARLGRIIFFALKAFVTGIFHVYIYRNIPG